MFISVLKFLVTFLIVFNVGIGLSSDLKSFNKEISSIKNKDTPKDEKRKRIGRLIIAFSLSAIVACIPLYINRTEPVKNDKPVFPTSANDNTSIIPTIEEGDFSWEPKEVIEKERITFVFDKVIDKKYKPVIQFADSSGRFSDSVGYYNSDEFIESNGKWEYHKIFNENGKTYFKLLIVDGKNSIVCKGSEKQIYVKSSDEIITHPYQVTIERIREGESYIDKYTNMVFAISEISYDSSFVTLTFPEGKKIEGKFRVGQTWDFEKDKLKFRVTLKSADFINDVYSIYIQELN